MRSVVFIHGAFMSAESWDPWRQRFEARGYRCLAPAWPFLDHSVEELRRAPDPRFGKLGITEIVDNYASIIHELEEPPILVGHSFGGLFVQLLLDRGFGAAGIALDPAPPKGVLPGGNAVRASLPVLLAWNSWQSVRRMSFKDFQWGWVHTLSEPEQRIAYEHVIPTSGRLFLQALLAPLTDETKVNYRNHLRAPLLIIAGELDRTVEAKMNHADFKKYAGSTAVTDYREFPGRTHWIVGQPGWEEVADHAMDWVTKQLGPTL
ncbi:MAG TPA: alpha/beta hydrolase [Candidatus Limnocylindria bacterium]|nr:alpha/beta hydrolase [Candidatus Limnocylindria bacterium]